MRALLDECVNIRLRHHLPGLEVRTADFMGWKGIKNGKLLAIAQEQFDILITLDANIPSQQQLKNFKIALFVLKAKSNALADLLPLVPSLLKAAKNPSDGVVTEISI